MRRWLPFMCVMALLPVLETAGAGSERSEQEKPVTASETLEQARQAYAAGQWKEARRLFLEVLREDPGRAEEVRRSLALVKAAERSGVRPVDLKARMERLTLDSIALKEATLKEAIALLRQKIAAQHGKDSSPNIIFKNPALDAKVSFSLGRIPASEVLRYIVELTGNRAIYESHAIVVTAAEAAE